MPYRLRAAAAAALVFLGACDGDDDGGDSAAADAAPPADAAEVADAAPPAPDADTVSFLSDQGLYSDIATKTVVAEALEYTPKHELWSDDAAKTRWIVFPEGAGGAPAAIDTSDMDHWVFPVGTKLFKEFRTPAGKRLETRLVRVDADAVYFATFIWNDEETEARFEANGADDILGTQHDVPSQVRCQTCHKGETGRVLGFSALQLAHDGPGPTLTSLAEAGRLSAPPPAGSDYAFPGTPVAAAALGYLHANCGHCHNPLGTGYMDTCLDDGMGNASDCMLLRLDVDEAGGADPLASGLAQSLIGKTTHSNWSAGFPRLTPGDPMMSAIHVRPAQRGSGAQMPPSFASEVVDLDGVAAVEAWIEELGLGP